MNGHFWLSNQFLGIFYQSNEKSQIVLFFVCLSFLCILLFALLCIFIIIADNVSLDVSVDGNKVQEGNDVHTRQDVNIGSDGRFLKPPDDPIYENLF